MRHAALTHAVHALWKRLQPLHSPAAAPNEQAAVEACAGAMAGAGGYQRGRTSIWQRNAYGRMSAFLPTPTQLRMQQKKKSLARTGRRHAGAQPTRHGRDGGQTRHLPAERARVSLTASLARGDYLGACGHS
jgi:hypothetical protein